MTTIFAGLRSTLCSAHQGQQLNKDGAAGKLRDLMHRGWLTGHLVADSDNSDKDEQDAKAASQEGSSQEVTVSRLGSTHYSTNVVVRYRRKTQTDIAAVLFQFIGDGIV